MRAGDAVSGRFQPPFRIFLEGPMLSLFERCYQICYQAGREMSQFQQLPRFQMCYHGQFYEMEASFECQMKK